MCGCYLKFKIEECDNYMHVTCARSSGLCNVNHGSNHLGMIESEEAWSLTCPDHVPAGTAHLRALAKTCPLEPKPAPPPRPFYKMTKTKRDKALADPEYEMDFLEIIKKKTNTYQYEVCYQSYSGLEFIPKTNKSSLMKCHRCDFTAHKHCLPQLWKVELIRNSSPKITCTCCLYVEEKETIEDFIKIICTSLHKDGSRKKIKNCQKKSLLVIC
jgi:hypothetical protein